MKRTYFVSYMYQMQKGVGYGHASVDTDFKINSFSSLNIIIEQVHQDVLKTQPSAARPVILNYKLLNWSLL